MTHLASARSWRPRKWDEIIGQQHVSVALQNALRKGRCAHAYLFSGIRGIGKTTLARILAKGLNCADAASAPCDQCDACMEIAQGRSVDVIEIDGASNTGVDDVRELREMAKYLPLRGCRKVYIIDEAHMLSNAAFNALLKILEEPPSHLVFILATTDPHKMPATILSRCQHFALRRLTRNEIVTQLSRVASERGVAVTEAGLTLIAHVAEGSMRDALTLLDQAMAYGEDTINEADLGLLLGRMGGAAFYHLAEAVHKKDAQGLLCLARDVAERGYDLRQFVADWLEHLRHLMMAQHMPPESGMIDLPTEEIGAIYAQSRLFTPESLQRLFALFIGLQSDMRIAPHPHLLFEVALMKTLLLSDLQPISQIIERLAALGDGAGTPISQTQTPGATRGTAVATAAASFSAPTPLDLGNRAAGAFGAEEWKNLLEQMKKERPNVGSYLGQGRLRSAGDDTLRIEFSGETAFLMALLQKEETSKWLSAFVRSHVQKAIVLVSEPAGEPLARPDPVRAPLHTVGRAAETPHLRVAEALAIFGGEVV